MLVLLKKSQKKCYPSHNKVSNNTHTKATKPSLRTTELHHTPRLFLKPKLSKGNNNKAHRLYTETSLPSPTNIEHKLHGAKKVHFVYGRKITMLQNVMSF